MRVWMYSLLALVISLQANSTCDTAAFRILDQRYSDVLQERPELAVWVHEAELRYNVPSYVILSVMHVESSFNPMAVSHSGAIGLMQVMPIHWPNLPYDIYTPEENILAGAYILRTYYRSNVCNYDWTCAIKAYNIGITNYKRGLKEDAANHYYAKVLHQLKRTYSVAH